MKRRGLAQPDSEIGDNGILGPDHTVQLNEYVCSISYKVTNRLKLVF